MTTVSVVAPLSFAQAVWGWFRSDEAVVPRDVIYPPNKTGDEVRKQDATDFSNSQKSATTAALKYLGFVGVLHVVVQEVKPDAPASRYVRTGDEIVAVDGRPVVNAGDLRTLIGTHKPGDRVGIRLLRAGSSRGLTVAITGTTNRAGAVRPVLGVGVNERTEFPLRVKISLGDIGGPSAGLMFALGIIDKLEPASLTNGRFIAGTGTIDDDGNVGPIGGIQQKLIGARRRGATVFLVPSSNCAEALSSPPGGLRLVKVVNLRSALTQLQNLRSGTPTAPCTGSAG